MGSTTPLLLLLSYALFVAADLPSCTRARCSHCQVQFIAQMCPQACAQCPPLRSVDDDTALQSNGGRRGPSAPGGSFTGTGRNSVAATQSARAAHGRPTAVGVPQLQTGAQYLQQQSQQPAGPQFSNAGGQPNVQPSASPQQQQQYQFAGVGQQTQPHQPAYTQVQLPQLPAQQAVPSNTAPYNFYQTSSNVGPAQTQPVYQPQGSYSQSSFTGQNYAVPSQPQLPQYLPSQSQQPAQTPAFNPFQPFLQHSLHAQTPFNPFMFPTPAPSLALFTPHSLPHTFNPFTLPPPPAAGASGPQLPTYTASPPPAPPPVPQPSPVPPPPPVPQPQYPQYQQQNVQPTYASIQASGAIPPPPPPPSVLRGDSSGYQTSNYPQAGTNPAETQRPRQIYYSGPDGQQRLQELPTLQERPTYAQATNSQQQQLQQQTLARPVPSARASPVAPSASSIDAPSAYVIKNAYAEKQGPYQGTGTCPKQPNWEPCIPKDLANERFRNCCQRLGDGCSQLCSYDSSLTTIQLAVLTGRCPIAKVADMMICASGYEDATPCCEAHGVFEPGFDHCRPYCNPAAGLPNDGMLAEKYRCLGKLSQIQRCFYVTQRP